MSIRALIVEENPVARAFLARVVRESFSDEIRFSEAGHPGRRGQEAGPRGEIEIGQAQAEVVGLALVAPGERYGAFDARLRGVRAEARETEAARPGASSPHGRGPAA